MTAHPGSQAGEHVDHIGLSEQDEAAARSNMLLAVKLGILSEVMLFGALFAAYFVIRSESPGWPPVAGLERPGLLLPGLNMLLLVASSGTMQWTLRSARSGEQSRIRRWAALTLLLGATFIVIQGYEFATNGFGLDAGTFGSTFYVLTGFHAAHVLAGLGLMAIVARRARRGLVSAQHHTIVEATSYYWHFVVLAGVFLFSTLYVL
ncbi:MAG: cytochrome c oxidase subunit 3 [Chloroflexota bacterium]|nr:cytochrome c oxidase subunit 3 [Chloroflexota bacterium]